MIRTLQHKSSPTTQGRHNAAGRMLLLTLLMLSFAGGARAQDSHWPEIDGFGDFNAFVAFVQVDGEYIESSDNWAAFEVGAFVGDECRGHAFLADYTEVYGDLHPIIELEIFFNNPGELVTFKLYDHVYELEYDICSVSSYDEEGSTELSVFTGDDHVETYWGEDEYIVLNFSDSQFHGLELADDGTDNSTIIGDNLENATDVKLAGRTLYKDGYWNTICLPFNVWIDDNPLEGATVKKLDNATMNGNTVHLTFADVTGWINAGVPYIIKWEDESGDDIVDPVFTDVWFDGLEEADRTVTMAEGNVKFIGYFDAFDIDQDNADIYYMTKENTLKHTGVARTLKAFRAYFQFSEAAKGRQLLLDFGDATGIVSIENGTLNIENEGAWHTVDGVKLNGQPRSKGVYIHGKRKVVVR